MTRGPRAVGTWSPYHLRASSRERNAAVVRAQAWKVHCGCPCSPGNCDGVYPLKVSLLDTENGSTVDSFTTHVIYTADVARTRDRRCRGFAP